MIATHNLGAHGFAIVPNVLTPAEIHATIRELETVSTEAGVRTRGGVYAIRNLLRVLPSIRELAESERIRQLAAAVLGDACRVVRGTLFDKTPNANWLVPWHQDLTVCVPERREVPGYGPWTRKAGVWHVQPPPTILEEMLSVRIHLDDCDEENGVLRVLPGTHLFGRLTAEQIAERQRFANPVICTVKAGGVVLMRPLILHASSASTTPAHRRVIHLDYAGVSLPGGLQWFSGWKTRRTGQRLPPPPPFTPTAARSADRS